jgi:hypothetical protein
MLILAASRYVMDRGIVGMGSPLKADNNWLVEWEEKHCFPL